MKVRKALLSLASLLLCLPASGMRPVADADTAATVVRPVFAAYTLEYGSAHLTDTYLTPLRYEGWHAGFDYQRYQAMRFAPRDWTMRLHMNLSVDKTDNPARNASMWDIMLSADWGMMRRFRPLPGLTLAAGASTGIELGCLYNPRNGNNPASAKAALTFNASGYAAWNGTLLGVPLTLRYQAMLPVTGVFFSPDYGELYYEIYLGNHSGLAHCAWWGNYFRYRQTLTADIHFGNTSLRVGYENNIFTSEVNHIVTRDISHRAILGISGEWISVSPRKELSAEARMISATY